MFLCGNNKLRRRNFCHLLRSAIVSEIFLILQFFCLVLSRGQKSHPFSGMAMQNSYFSRKFKDFYFSSSKIYGVIW